jgi:hypothetical protein
MTRRVDAPCDAHLLVSGSGCGELKPRRNGSVLSFDVDIVLKSLFICEVFTDNIAGLEVRAADSRCYCWTSRTTLFGPWGFVVKITGLTYSLHSN